MIKEGSFITVHITICKIHEHFNIIVLYRPDMSPTIGFDRI